MKRHNWLALSLLLASSATSAEMLPDAVDLKAAFCTGVLRQHQPIVFKNQGDLPPEAQSMVDRVEAKFQKSWDRVQSYLLPRIPYLDVDSMLLAISQGERANAEALEEIGVCQKKGAQGMTACVDIARARIKDCYSLDFLPY